MRTDTPTGTWSQNNDGSWTPERVTTETPHRALVVEGVKGAPPASLATRAGLYYFRSDTPSTANQRIYVSTAVGVWSGIA